jgi:hypothetical protein
MARESIRMARLNSRNLLTLAAATSAITLSTARKLKRNFSYYRSEGSDSISRDTLISLCLDIRHDAFGLRNLMDSDDSFSPFYVALAGKISDQLEELHRKLLFFDADLIEELIPEIDAERAFWKELTEPGFYSEALISHLDHKLPARFIRIEIGLERLPFSVSI